ncbi:hypothetical protein IscW_ISCW001483, partial [Ixodes scapularis]
VLWEGRRLIWKNTGREQNGQASSTPETSNSKAGQTKASVSEKKKSPQIIAGDMNVRARQRATKDEKEASKKGPVKIITNETKPREKLISGL